MVPRSALPQWPTLRLERDLAGRVCGVDEAGCAPLAGPVVAAAVVLPRGAKPRALRGLTDSKLLSAEERERFLGIIERIADVGVGIATVEEIDRLNIFRADMLAMQRAVEALATPPDAALVDGRGRPALGCPVTTLVQGDRRSLSIAAASVVAKVTRDRIMRDLARQHPGYGWHSNAGYGTEEHYLGLLRLGPTAHHRRSFAPLTTVFAELPGLRPAFRFEPASEDRPDLGRVELLELRRDLHAVFDRTGLHLGQLKSLRGRWIFQATGYGADGEPEAGAGPCAGWHGRHVTAAHSGELRALFSSVVG